MKAKPVGNTPLAQYLNDYINNKLHTNEHQFALNIGLSQSQISRIIKGEGNPLGPKGQVRELLAKEFGLSLEEFEQKFALPANKSVIALKEDTSPFIQIKSFVELVDKQMKGDADGLSEQFIIEQIEKNDQNNYPETYENQYLAERIVEKEGAFQWARFMKLNSNYCKLLINYSNTTPEIIGDWQITPIYEEEFRGIKGNAEGGTGPLMTETDLSDNKVPSMTIEGEYHIFLLNYSINLVYNTPSLNKVFMKSFIDTIQMYENEGIHIKDILTRPCNSGYQNLFRDYGFVELNDTAISENDGSIICTEEGGVLPLYYLDDIGKLII